MSKGQPRDKLGRFDFKHESVRSKIELPAHHPDNPDVELTEEEWEAFATYLTDPDMHYSPEFEKAYRDPLTHTTIAMHVVHSEPDEANLIFHKYKEAGFAEKAATMRLMRQLV